MTSRDALTAAIEALYAAFAPCPLERFFPDRCSPLGDRRVLAMRLSLVELRAARADDVLTYAFKALSTMGDEVDLKHFLPRILELHARERWADDDTHVFRKLTELAWRTWPAREVAALETYIRELWLAATRGEVGLLNDQFSCILQAGLDPSPFLDGWLVADAKELEAAAELISWIDYRDAEFAAVRPAVARWAATRGFEDRFILAPGPDLLEAAGILERWRADAAPRAPREPDAAPPRS